MPCVVAFDFVSSSLFLLLCSLVPEGPVGHLVSTPQLPTLAGENLKGKLVFLCKPEQGRHITLPVELNSDFTTFSWLHGLPDLGSTIPVVAHV